jgi:S1-C subfamily serine protease
VRVIVQHTSGARAGQRQEFRDPALVRFGRHPSNDVQFDTHHDLDASARHAELRREGAQFRLVDVGSSNGTLMGGERVSERLIVGGEEVQFGVGGPCVRILIDNLDLPPTLEQPRSMGARHHTYGPPPPGMRTTAFRQAVHAAVAQATRPIRALVIGLALAATLTGVGLLIYRARSESREAALRNQMVALMERQRTASPGEQPGLKQTLERMNGELKTSGTGPAISRAARGAIYLLAVKYGKVEDGFCTAFAIESQVLVTNSHCVAAAEDYQQKGARAFVVRNGHPENRFFVGAVKKHPHWKPTLREVTEDVGLLQIEGKVPETLELASDEELKRLSPGDAIYLYGFPGRLADTRSPEATFVQGVIGRMTRMSGEAGPFSATQLVQHSAFTSGGTSGSPIFNDEGHVVAVNAGGYVEEDTMHVTDPQSGRGSQMVVSSHLAGYNFGMRVDLVRALRKLVE